MAQTSSPRGEPSGSNGGALEDFGLARKLDGLGRTLREELGHAHDALRQEIVMGQTGMRRQLGESQAALEELELHMGREARHAATLAMEAQAERADLRAMQEELGSNLVRLQDAQAPFVERFEELGHAVTSLARALEEQAKAQHLHRGEQEETLEQLRRTLQETQLAGLRREEEERSTAMLKMQRDWMEQQEALHKELLDKIEEKARELSESAEVGFRAAAQELATAEHRFREECGKLWPELEKSRWTASEAIGELRVRFEEVKTLQEQLRGDVGHLREEGRRNGAEVNDLKQILEALRSDIKHLQERTGEQETKRLEIVEKLDLCRRELSKQLEELRREYMEQITTGGRALEVIKAANQLESQKREELATRLGGAEERISSQMELVGDLRVHLEEVRGKHAQLCDDLVRVRGEVKQGSGEIAGLRQTLEALQRALGACEQCEKELAQQQERDRGALNEPIQRLSTLEQRTDTLSERLVSTQERLKAQEAMPFSQLHEVDERVAKCASEVRAEIGAVDERARAVLQSLQERVAAQDADTRETTAQLEERTRELGEALREAARATVQVEERGRDELMRYRKPLEERLMSLQELSGELRVRMEETRTLHQQQRDDLSHAREETSKVLEELGIVKVDLRGLKGQQTLLQQQIEADKDGRSALVAAQVAAADSSGRAEFSGQLESVRRDALNSAEELRRELATQARLATQATAQVEERSREEPIRFFFSSSQAIATRSSKVWADVSKQDSWHQAALSWNK